MKGLLSEELRGGLAALPPVEDRSATYALAEQLRGELNGLLARRDLYDEAAWQGVRLDGEARELRDEGVEELSDERLARFNRKLLEAAFSDYLMDSGGPKMQMKYLVWDAPFDASEVNAYRLSVKATLYGFMYAFVGIIGVFVAILVTASIVPNTFEAGAIDLLLSKPVSRSAVFVTKYLGGCAFILIIATSLIAGLWLILGLRLDIWQHNLLLCIPIFTFIFAIFYAVSALAGVLWRNAIVSVVVAIAFWCVCTLIVYGKPEYESRVSNHLRIIKLVPVEGDTLAIGEAGQVWRWNTEVAIWDEQFLRRPQNSLPSFVVMNPGGLAGPIYDPGKRRLLTVDSPFSEFAGFGSSSPLWVGSAEAGWVREQGIDAPPGTEALFLTPRKEVLAVAPSGVYRLEGDPLQAATTTKVLGFEVATGGGAGSFQHVVGNPANNSPFSAAMDPASGEIAVFDGRRLAVLAPGDGGLQVRAELPFDEREEGLVAFATDFVLLVLKDGRVRVYDSENLAEVRETDAPTRSAPRFTATSPDGRTIAVVFHDGYLWLYDAQQDAEVDADWVGQGDISAVAFKPDGGLVAADSWTRVTEYEAGSWRELSRRQPPRDYWERGYRYVVNPLYTLFPRPAEMNDIVRELLMGEELEAVQRLDLSAAPPPSNYWSQVRNNTIFIVVVLALGCLYVSRKDF